MTNEEQGRESSEPHSKENKVKSRGQLERAKSALSRLVNTPLEIQYMMLYSKQVYGDDRTAVIMLACDVENSLDIAIKSCLNPEKSVTLFREQDGPVSTFSRKIRLAYALDIIGPKHLECLELIRTLRNAFAHASKPINFFRKEVRDLLNLMAIPDYISAGNGAVFRDPFFPGGLYRSACEVMKKNLYDWSRHAENKIEVDENTPRPVSIEKPQSLL